MIERTLILAKPDAVQRGLVGEIVKRFEGCGLKIVGMKMVKIDSDFAKKHYSAHIQKEFYPQLESRITSGPVIAFVVEGIRAVGVVKKMVGDTGANVAVPGTIRGDFAHVNLDHRGAWNVVHASGNPEEAKQEIALWFDDVEIHNYKTLYEQHLEFD